jgi:protein gp37
VGVSVEDPATADERLPVLREIPAIRRWVSYEPALAPVDFRPHIEDDDGDTAIDWIIVGGESGPGARPFNVAWARDTIQTCRAAGIPCFVKQLGGNPRASEHERLRDTAAWPWRPLNDSKGADPKEWPLELRVQEFPA